MKATAYLIRDPYGDRVINSTGKRRLLCARGFALNGDGAPEKETLTFRIEIAVGLRDLDTKGNLAEKLAAEGSSGPNGGYTEATLAGVGGMLNTFNQKRGLPSFRHCRHSCWGYDCDPRFH